MQECLHNTHSRQKRHQQVRQRRLRMCSRSWFCEGLHASTTKTHEHEHEDNYGPLQHTMTPCTMQELHNAINQLKRGKAADTRVLNAEMIKHSNRRVKQHLPQQSHQTKRRRATRLAGYHDQLRYKSEDPPSPSNVYMLLSQLFFKRLQPTPDANQSVDQARFRLGYSTTDH